MDRTEWVSRGITVSSGAYLNVAYGDSLVNATVDSGGQVYVYSGGATTGTTLEGQEFIVSGGTATGTIVDGGTEFLYSGTTSGTVVNSGGVQCLVQYDRYAKEVTSNTTVNGGGIQEISATYAVAIDTVVNSGGEQIIYFGTASGTILNKDAAQIIGEYNYASAVATTVTSATEQVSTYGTTSRTVLSRGGTEIVSSGGASEGTLVNSGGFLIALPGSKVAGTVTKSGGLLISTGVFIAKSVGGVYSGNYASGTAVTAGETDYVLGGGTAVNTQVAGSELVYVGGTTIGSIIGSGAVENVSAGTASGTIVKSGGVFNVSQGGVANGTQVDGGEASLNGTNSGTDINSGGFAYAFGITIGSVINSGGTEFAGSGVYGAIVNNGGIQVVDNNTVVGTVINSGGIQLVEEAASGSIVSSGGTLQISNEIYDDPVVSGALIDQGGMIDLLGIPYTATEQIVFIPGYDLLEVNGQGASFTMQLSGTYTGGEFDPSSDGHGGTLLTFNEVGQTYTLTKSTDVINGGAGDDTIIAANGTLNSGDMINGGAGFNTLELSGPGGLFSLAAPATLANIQVVDATEGQAASGKIKSTTQTVTLRAGLNVTLNIASGLPVSGNAHPETITIYGNTDASTINLGAGTDTVILGGGSETINAGYGTAIIQGAITDTGTLINGNSQNATDLEITTAGTGTLNPGDTNLTITLSAGSNLTLSKMGYVTAIGSTSADTITALAANQTLTGGGGADTLIGYAGGGDLFSDSTTNLNSVTIGNWAALDVINLTDMNFTGATEIYAPGTGQGVLTIANGAQSAAITITGTYTAANFTLAAGVIGTFVDYST